MFSTAPRPVTQHGGQQQQQATGTGSAQQQQQQQQQVTVTGQITYRRRLSAKLLFYDILQSDPAAHDSIDQRWEVVVKAGVFGTVQDVKDLRDSLKLGDIIAFTGWPESSAEQGHSALQAVSVSVTQPWRASNPSTAFIPQPAPQKHRQQHSPAPPQQQQQPLRPLQERDDQDGHATLNMQAVAAAAAEDLIPANVASSPASSSTAQALSQPAAAAAGGEAGCTMAAASSKVAPPQVAVCKFWVNTGRCAKGADCPYLHALLPAAGAAASRRGWLQQREIERQQRAADMGFVHNSSAAAKRQRAAVFAAWLVQQYGKESLNAGAGVLDVAGGTGSLTFELAFVHGIKCTLVDPRALKLNKHHHRQLQQAQRTAAVSTLTLQHLQQGDLTAAHEVQHAEQDCKQEQEQEQQGVECVTAQQQQPSEHDGMFGQLDQHVIRGAGTVQQQNLQDGSLPGSGPLGGDSNQQPGSGQLQFPTGCCSDPLKLQQVQAWFGPELWSTPGWQQLYSNCSLVVGLHPDQATEFIVDYAVQQQLPFAVVPCCVFPRMFPHRRVQHADGGDAVPVVSYDQLVEYLLQRGGEAHRQVLHFEGANIVIARF